MTDSASLKIERAKRHICELNQLILKKRPFSLVVETDTRTGKHTAFIKNDKTVIDAVATISGDVIHNLRSALDHAYWEIVSPHATSSREAQQIQFPFSRTAAQLEKSISNRLADRVSDHFFQALVDLKPHGESGGNEPLYLIHQMDVLDKHKLLIPTCDETRLPYDEIRRLFPGFPVRASSTVIFSQCIFTWSSSKPSFDIGTAKLPTTYLFEREAPIDVAVVFSDSSPFIRRPVIPTLQSLAEVAQESIGAIRAAS